MTEFVKESIEWMKEIGYSLHYQNGDGTSCNFTHDSLDDTYPAIRCNDKNGYRTCEVYSCSNFKWFLTLSTSAIMFRHPDIKKVISIFRHYEQLAKDNPPF